MAQGIDEQFVEIVVAGLLGGIDVEDGATSEQLNLLSSLTTNLWGRDDLDLGQVSPLSPSALAAKLEGEERRRRFCELLMVLEMCRHPQLERQLSRVEEYIDALDVHDLEVEALRTDLERGADAASRDLERYYDVILPEISEISLRDHYLHLETPDHSLSKRLQDLHNLGEGTLGYEYIEFYRRNNIELPGDDVHVPAHYVNHDMNHVITGYEPTAPGEIARSGFLAAANESQHNWIEFLLTLSIHETGILNHGAIRAKVATLDRSGTSDLLAEGFARGARCSVDLSQVDHLAIADRDLEEIRAEFNIVPLAKPMI